MIRMILTEEQGTDSAFNRFLVIYNLMKLMIMILVILILILIWWLSVMTMLIMMLIMMWSLVVDQNKTWTSGQEGSSITVPAFAASAPDRVIIILNIIIIIFIVSNVNKSLDFPFFGGQCCLFTNAVMSWPSSPDRKVGPRLTVTLANLKKRLLSPKVGPSKIHYQIIKRPNPTHCGLSFSILATFGFALDYDDMKRNCGDVKKM